VILFLSGLNESFSIVRTQILLMDPLPPLNKVYSLVAQEESHEGIDVVDDIKVLVNAVESKKPYGRGKGSIPQGGKGSRQCNFCGNQDILLNLVIRNMVFLPTMVMVNSTLMQILSKLKILMNVVKDLVR